MPAGVEAILANRGEIDAELRKHKSPITVMFTDLKGSTSFFDRFGDTVGLAWIDEHNKIVIPEVVAQGGKVVKTIGDSVMAYFTDPGAAVKAAAEIQKKLVASNQGKEDTNRMYVRVALHHGLGYLRGGDVFGDVVNVAARIARACSPLQILVSESVYLAAHHGVSLPFHQVGAIRFQGKVHPENTYEVVWTDEASYAGMRQQFPSRAEIIDESEAAGRYLILNEIGRGAMGVVYRVYDQVIGRVVAMKTISLDLEPEARTASVERLKLEARTAGMLDHPNIVTIHDVGEESGLFFLTMQYLEGRTLGQLQESKEILPLDKSFAIADQICSAVGHAHKAGIIHRDLKPSNVILTDLGIAKVLDFGIAKIGDLGLTRSGQVLGTPGYLAPEQATGRRVDHRADIFALGILIYELFTNERAFPGESTTAIVYKIVNEQPTPLQVVDPSLPSGLEHVIAKALAKNPDDRYQSCEDLRAALAQCRSAVPTALPQGTPATAYAGAQALSAPGAVSQAAAPSRKPILIGVGVGVLIAALGIGGAMVWVKNQTKAPAAPAEAAKAAPAASAPVVPPPANTVEMLAKADELQRAGNLDAAAQALNAFVEHAPDNVPVRIRYAVVLGMQKRFADALSQYQLVLKVDPTNVVAQVGVARVTSWMNDLPKALQLYNAVLAKNPKNYDARVGKAFTLMWMQRPDEARALFEAAARENPNDSDVAAALLNLSSRKQ